MLDCRCEDCERPFKSATDASLCPRCEAIEDAQYRNDPLPVELPPAAWTRAALQERLGVCGDVDE